MTSASLHRPLRPRWVLLAALALLASNGLAAAGDSSDFAHQVDGRALSRLPVQYQGRVGILDTQAREQLEQMCGTQSIDDLPPAVAYLELYLCSGKYLDQPLLPVKEQPLLAALLAQGILGPQTRAALDSTHKLPPACLMDADACFLLLARGRAEMADFRRTRDYTLLAATLADLEDKPDLRQPVQRLGRRFAAFLGEDALRIVPAEGTWLPIDNLDAMSQKPAGTMPATAPTASQAFGDPELASLTREFYDLRRAWRARDAQKVNLLIHTLGEHLRARAQAVGAAYPSETLARVELLYNRAYKSTVALVGLVAAIVLMIVAAASGARWPRRLGMIVLVSATGVLLAGFVGRWVLSGRPWYLPPVMNMFEAVTASALLAAAVGVVLELVLKLNYLGLSAALYATVALLAGLLFPEWMDPAIRAQHGLLASRVMAAHVATIIIGYAMVGMTFFISVVYLAVLPFARRASRAHATASPGAAGLAEPLRSIDRCNLVAAQLALWMVLVGTVLGAYWADFAWGRFWGWDVKEAWALITVAIYVLILHARTAVSPRAAALLTAILCIVGMAIMIFNWIVVNFFLPGLHSYA